MSENEVTNQNDEQNTPSNDDRNIIVIGILLSIFFYCLPVLVIYFAFGKDKLSPFAYKNVLNLFNFEIYVTLIYLVLFVICPFIPIAFIGFLVLWVFNLIICIQAFQAYNDGKEYTYPLNTTFIK